MVGRPIWLLRSTPTYWQDNQAFLQATPAPQLDALAKSIEARLPSEFTKPIGPGEGTRTLRINFDEANAWLSVRLRPYLENQNITLPDELGQFMLTQRDGQLVLAFDYNSSRLGQRVASLFIKLGNQPSDENPLVSIGIDKLLAGNQPLSTSLVLDKLRSIAGDRHPDAVSIIEQLQSGEMVALPTLPVDAHRVADVLSVNVLPQSVELELRVRFKTP
jgi:hypothetical protein